MIIWEVTFFTSARPLRIAVCSNVQQAQHLAEAYVRQQRITEKPLLWLPYERGIGPCYYRAEADIFSIDIEPVRLNQLLDDTPD